MTKAKIIVTISKKTGLEKKEIQSIIDSFIVEIKSAITSGDSVFLKDFGRFAVKKRAKKTARNLNNNTSIIIPAHNIPVFKPSKTFVEEVKKKLPVIM